MKAFLIALLKIELAVIFFGIFGPALVAALTLYIGAFFAICGVGVDDMPTLMAVNQWGFEHMTWWLIK